MEKLEMTKIKIGEQNKRKPLRLWPGVVIVVLQWLIRYGLPLIRPETMQFAVNGGVPGGFALIL
jgi:hypothetical protein